MTSNDKNKNDSSTAATVCRTTLALALAGAGAAKVSKQQAMLDSADHLGYSTESFQAIGAAELAGSAGLLLGGKKPGLGVAAALGAAGVLGGAVVEHVRHGDGPDAYGPPAGLGVLALVTAQKLKKLKKLEKLQNAE